MTSADTSRHSSYPHSRDLAARPPAPVWPSSRTFRDATPDQKLAYLRRLRDDPSLPLFDEPPIPGLPRGRGYRALTRHADVVEVSRRPGDFCSGQGTLWINDFGPELNEFFGSLINLDDPRHGQLRRLVVAAFTPRTVRRLYDNLGALAAETVASAARRSTLDLVADLATPFPLAVIGDLLGIPKSCRADMLAASNIIMSGGDPEFVHNQQDPVSAFLQAGNDLGALATELAEERRRRPADDLLTELVQAEVDGTRLSTREIASFFILLAIAGQETTRNAISLGLWALHNNPAAHQAWTADFDRLAPTAVEEILRYGTPIATMRRTVTRDTTLNEHHLTVGDKVLLFYAAANRDERIFPEPDRFDITRTLNQHLSFGGPGPHFCLGSHLARAELTAIFREIFHSCRESRSPTNPTSFDRSSSTASNDSVLGHENSANRWWDSRARATPPDGLGRSLLPNPPNDQHWSLDIYRSINALAESVNGLYKTELIHRKGPWRTADDVELATFEWVDWYNNRRIHSGCGNMPPADFETLFYIQDEADIVAEA